MRTRILAVAALALILAGCGEKQGSTSQVTRKNLGKMGNDYASGTLTLSGDMGRAAWVVKRGDKKAIVFDGTMSAEYDEIVPGSQWTGGPVEVVTADEWAPALELAFSPDSKRLAFAAKREGKWRVVVDGVEGNGCDGIRTVTWSPDSAGVAYIAKVGGTLVPVVDGVEGAQYKEVRDFAFGKDGKISYRGDTRDKVVFVEGGAVVAELPLPASPKEIVVSPNRRRIACIVNADGGEAVVADGAAGKTYPRIVKDEVRFSPDSSRLAYIAGLKRELTEEEALQEVDPGETLYVVDGKELGPYYSCDSIIFSPDSKHWASRPQFKRQWTPSDGKREPAILYLSDPSGKSREVNFGISDTVYGRIALLDGVAGPGYLHVGEPLWSADGAHMAYLSIDKAGDDRMVLDGTPGPKFDEVKEPFFSGDGQLCYEARRDKKRLVVCGDATGFEYDSISYRAKSADGAHWAYTALKKGKLYVIRDGVIDGRFDKVKGEISESRMPQLSADGSGIAFTVLRGQNDAVVANGEEGESHSAIRFLTLSPSGKHFAYEGADEIKRVAFVDHVPQEFAIWVGQLHFSDDNTLLVVVDDKDGLARVELRLGE